MARANEAIRRPLGRAISWDPTSRNMAPLTALLSVSRLFHTGSIPMPASRFLCEHLHQNLFFWACISRIHAQRSEEHTSELQSRLHLVCRLLLEKKKIHRPVQPRLTYLPPTLPPLASSLAPATIAPI